MKISDIGEFGLIKRIRKTAGRIRKGVQIGIGDDAAVLRCSPGAELLATTDMLLEGVHFDLRTTDFRSLGWKSAAVNLSDIAAMGGTPRFCLATLAIPRHVTVENISAFYRGLNALLKRHKVSLVGGDTCGSLRDLIVNIVILGEVPARQVLKRSGAQMGDIIFVTGTLGDSAAGLELLKAEAKGQVAHRTSTFKKLIEKHLRPRPRVDEGRKLALAGIASAMIDVSDGLSSDLEHICEESGVGALVLAKNVPLSRSLCSVSTLRRSPLEYALSGGEDYELLFTVPREKWRRVKKLPIDATAIGFLTRRRTIILSGIDGKRTVLRPSGYDHFGATSRYARRRGR
ncbi:MAG: thiamine-phosphate kinase [Nitrospiraceae bacterium]|nr:thiamine-phosphate kinase [Nitrospiraceae bacterium]